MVLRFHRLPSGGINISMQDALQNRLLIMPVEQGEKRKPTLLLKVNLLFIEGYSWFELSQWILEWQPSFWSVHGSLTVSRRTIRRLSWTSMISRKKKSNERCCQDVTVSILMRERPTAQFKKDSHKTLRLLTENCQNKIISVTAFCSKLLLKRYLNWPPNVNLRGLFVLEEDKEEGERRRKKIH